MIIKTSEVTGIVLNWAVAKIEGRSCTNFYGHPVPEFIPRYSTDWELGGPIIDREVIHTWTDRKDAAYAGHPDEIWVASTASDMSPHLWGPTPLIAAMRCYVASKLGDELDVPSSLLEL